MAYPIIDDLAGTRVMDRGRLLDADSSEAAELFAPTDRTMFYEFIRIVRGVPLFWEDHMARLSLSVRPPVTIPDSLYADSLRLISANGLDTANLRVVLLEGQTVIHLTPSNFPSPELFEQGVPTGILAWERESPNIKLIRSDYKAAIAERFARPGPFGRCYELLLADRQGFLTEGSRSNLFFIRGSQVLTAPDSRILKGITRKHILEAIAQAGGELTIAMLTLDDIRGDGCDAAFLSSSPFDILPVSAIEDFRLPSAANPLLRRIDAAYRAMVADYVAEKTSQHQ